MSFRFVRGARTEVADGIAHYEMHQEGLGERFYRDVKRAIRAAIDDPKRYVQIERKRSRRELRRVDLGDFPFSVIYEVMPDEIVVLAIAHQSRRDEYWARRSSKRENVESHPTNGPSTPEESP